MTHKTRLGLHGIRFFAGFRFHAPGYLSWSGPATWLGPAKFLEQRMMIIMSSSPRTMDKMISNHSACLYALIGLGYTDNKLSQLNVSGDSGSPTLQHHYILKYHRQVASSITHLTAYDCRDCSERDRAYSSSARLNYRDCS